jgi:hypothetical protein
VGDCVGYRTKKNKGDEWFITARLSLEVSSEFSRSIQIHKLALKNAVHPQQLSSIEIYPYNPLIVCQTVFPNRINRHEY